MAPITEIFSVPPLGCNCSIIGDSESKKAVVVDPGGDVSQILRKLEEKGLTCEKILVTHGHLDHILGADELKKATGAPIVMHQDDLSLYQDVAGQCTDFRVPLPTNPLPTPDAFMADNDTSTGDIGFRCVHCPGHTAGSVAFLFEQQNLLCVGDTLFRGGVGRTSWAGLPSLEGTSDSQQLLQSIKFKLLPLPDDLKVICGHGPCTTIGREKTMNPFVR
mmetsp:Transcript_17273/g.23868  ORF Transcript_17273/g.23868 Transcript_17273/m.23868 type:complete len:219 (+) Transcript_17273:43-699(+)|eukprot:CAMPEP_0196583208 /NCGR_PEP_ID=MMETSP1081-20130531/42525_1 /TAXON_ID=36882 /ORGANISM="Pyramimonas amylifera, Strain CCMP720" /LENGTH=218 /DNA_ID=CAMNT_0041904021 /DNA_START=29 /DNA_END=685 /DNA_ORIENTATION=-